MADTANILALSPSESTYCAVAPLGTSLPTSATATLDPAFIELGWVTDDGVTNSPKRDITKHYAWGGEVVKVTLDKYTETLKLSLYESSDKVLKVVFGDDHVTTTTAGGHQVVTVEHSPLMLGHSCFVFTGIDGDRTVRSIVRDGQITEIGDIVWVHSKPTVYELTIDVFKTVDGDPGVFQIFDNADVLAGS